MATNSLAASGDARRAHSRWLVLVIVCFAQFMVVLDATIVNVALPSIQTDLNLSGTNLQWIVNAYTLVFGGFLLLGGRAADLIGRRRVFTIGLLVFSGSSLACALAQSGEMLIVARGFQGLGGALISPAALSIITTTFDEGPDRTKALSIWGGIAAGGAAFGLLLGGILTETLSWEWNFIINVPIGVGVLFAALRIVPESKQENATRHFDVLGAVTVTAGLMLLVYAIVKAQEWGWGSTNLLATAAGALALLAIFIAIELRSPQPLVRLAFFKKRWISTANFAMFLVAGGMFGMFYFASLYVQQIMDFGPLRAGLAFLPVSLGIMTGAVASQQLIGRLGVKPVVITGMMLAATGLAILSTMTQVDGTYLMLLSGLLPMAIGMGMTFVPLTLVATAGVEADDAGLASGTFNTSQQIGGALGLAVLATLASNKTTSVLENVSGAPAVQDRKIALVEGFQTAFVASASLTAFGLLMVVLLMRRRDVESVHIGEAAPVPV
ncbi:MAG TPA: MFS transporter [Solirubrobacterales bacterium]|jgi:EmrB/QacA subfamily drug resistance transporter|nr:MFS transporter [Solirubrobacterales bacterium]